jgi:hypothetical protein
MIRDVAELRRTESRADGSSGRRDDAQVHTFLIPSTVTDANSSADQQVFAVRTNPPPDPAVQQQGLLRWWPVNELTMPFDRWRAALHQLARRDHVHVHTFLVPPPSTDRADFHDRADHAGHDQLVYVAWAVTTSTTDIREPPGARSATALPDPHPEPHRVTSLTAYRTAQSSRADSIARHPSSQPRR